MTKNLPDNVMLFPRNGTIRPDAETSSFLSEQAALDMARNHIAGFDADLSDADFPTCHAWVLATIDALPTAAV